MMLVYTATITPRLQYIFNFLSSYFKTEFSLTSDKEVFISSHLVRLNYSDERITKDEIRIKPHHLLFERDIKQQSIQCFDLNGNKAFFKTEGDFPFDIFAASFYLISRYEEYLPHQKDKYGRYAHHNSLAYKEGFLHLPLINIWLGDFRKLLLQKNVTFSILHSQFSFLPTYDIDEAFSYKYKGFVRTVGGMAKAAIKADLNRVQKRTAVLQGRKNDPFNSYQWMDELHERYHLSPRYFFLVPSKLSKYDRNILPHKQVVKDLIVQHAKKYTVGLHPSWQSGDDPSLIKKEKERIESITHKPLASSRQHFIRFNLPYTYRHLINAGIKEEFSMGYGTINGFRASVASPFYWYDFEREEQTDLLVYPFCYMEANSFFEQKFSPAQALDEMMHYYNVIKEVHGTMITIWHNTFLGTDKLYKGWREAYEKFIGVISSA
jgi:hypothetical protein